MTVSPVVGDGSSPQLVRQKDASLRGSVTQLWEQAVLDRIHAPVYEKSERVFVFVALRVALRGQALVALWGQALFPVLNRKSGPHGAPENQSRVGNGCPAGSNKLRVSPSPSRIPHDRVLYATAVLAPRSKRSPKGFPRSRTFRFNEARLPATPTCPSRGPWLARRLCCPSGSSLTTALSEPPNPSPPLMNSRRGLLHPRKSASSGNPEVPQFTPLDCARVPPPIPRWPRRVHVSDRCFLIGFSLHLERFSLG